MPGVFDKLGIRFMYPDNWQLDESEALSGENTVTVYSPDGSFWMVRVWPREIEPAALVDQALATMRREYQDLDAEAFDDTYSDVDVVGCEINFYCLDLTNTAIVRAYRTPTATIVVMHQADDRALASIGPVFDAMTQSLMTATIDTPNANR